MPSNTPKGRRYEKQALIKRVRERANQLRVEPWLFNTDGQGCAYTSPKHGTTAYAAPNEKGVYAEPVFYDWGANWERVKTLVPGKRVQRALKLSLQGVADGYLFRPYERESIWPHLFVMHRRYGNGERDGMVNEYLPESFIRDVNNRMANYTQALGQVMVEDYLASPAEWDNEEEVEDDDDDNAVWEESIGLIWDEFFDYQLWEASLNSPFVNDLHRLCEAKLYDPDNSPFREKLLLCCPSSYGFMPLNYALAKLLSPWGTDLRVYASSEYSVVYDATHNIVFDNFWYFIEGIDAAETLEASKKLPRKDESEFDYSLGGLRGEDATTQVRSQTKRGKRTQEKKSNKKKKSSAADVANEGSDFKICSCSLNGTCPHMV
jgi:hypothetical protein